MNWKCWFFHKWSKWVQGTAEHKTIFDKEWSACIIQKRECERCGKTQIQRLIG